MQCTLIQKLEQKKHKMHVRVHNRLRFFMTFNRQTLILLNMSETLWKHTN